MEHLAALTVGLLANLVAWQVIFGTNVLLSIPLGPRMILAGLLVVASGGFAVRALIAVRKYRSRGTPHFGIWPLPAVTDDTVKPDE